MSYEYITKFNSPNYGYSNDGTHPHGQNTPNEILIHHWDDPAKKPTFEGCIRELMTDRGLKSKSAHLVLEANRVACLVNFSDSAYHSGDYFVNNHSIGIECNPRCSEGDVNTLIEVIVDIWNTYGVLPLRGHKDVVPTGCPGRYYPRLNEIYNRALKLYDSQSRPEPEDTKVYKVQVGAFKNKKNAQNLQKELKTKGYDCFIVEVE